MIGGDGKEVKTVREVPGEGSVLCLPRLLLMRDKALPKQNWQLLETLALMMKTEPAFSNKYKNCENHWLIQFYFIFF